MRNLFVFVILVMALPLYAADLRYNTSDTIYFALLDTAGEDLEISASCVSGDVQYSIDGGTFSSTTNCFSHKGNGIYSLVLTAGETLGEDIAITVTDQTATKVWLDQPLFYETFGHASAKYATDIDAPNYLSSLKTIHKGIVDNSVISPTTVLFEADSLENNDGSLTIPTAADFYKSRIVIFTTGSVIGQVGAITQYAKVGSNARFTVTSLAVAPVNNDEFVILPHYAPEKAYRYAWVPLVCIVALLFAVVKMIRDRDVHP